jgi:hypothetical protein
MPETSDMMGGKSIEDDIPTNTINANNASPNNSGSCPEGHRLQTKFSL